MKLLAKTSIYYFISAILVLVIGGFIFFSVLKIIFYRQVDDNLLTEKNLIEEEIKQNLNIPDYSSRFGHEIEVILYNRFLKKSFLFKDTLIYDTIREREVHYRYMFSADNTPKRGYSITILHPLRETRILLKAIIKVLMVMFLALLLILIIINYYISKKLWLPFYKTLKAIRNYEVNNKSLMNFAPTNVTEFEELNKVLHTMSEKIRQDFFNLKEFTENASHEIQTPLAVIKSKLELMVQSDHLEMKDHQLIQAIETAVSRLSKLNSGLLLITKIENHQFDSRENIDIQALIKRTISIFEEFIEHRKIKVEVEFENHFPIWMNSSLAEILVSNLINNAINHNVEHGTIRISLVDKKLNVVNTGESIVIDPVDVFNRFRKISNRSDSLGLGLAIVKKICDFYNIGVTYQSIDSLHTVSVDFKNMS